MLPANTVFTTEKSTKATHISQIDIYCHVSKKRRYLILCTLQVSGLTCIRYTKKFKRSKSQINQNSLEANRNKRPQYDSQNLLRLSIPGVGEP